MPPDGLELGLETFARFRDSWDVGSIVIVATMAEGPHAGRQVICITPRRSVLRGLSTVRTKLHYPGFLPRLRGAIHAQVTRGMGDLSPATDKDFMSDLAIMMAVKLATGREDVLDGSGLFSLMIVIDQDETRRWDQRGLLSAEHVGGEAMRL